MVENARMKELTADVKCSADTIQKMYNDFHEQIDKMEVAKASRFAQMKVM